MVNVLPFCNTEAMQLHLNEIATKVSAGAHAILILDQAGWHGAMELKIPTNTRSCGCRRAHPSSTAKKISGNSCARIGYRTASSNPSTISSITAATPGTPSSTSHGRSCPSHCAIGLQSVSHFEDWYKIPNKLFRNILPMSAYPRKRTCPHAIMNTHP